MDGHVMFGVYAVFGVAYHVYQNRKSRWVTLPTPPPPTHTYTHPTHTHTPLSIIAVVTLSSDFIAGFCGETEEDHKETISLMEAVQFDMAYMYAYSMRKVRGGRRERSVCVYIM